MWVVPNLVTHQTGFMDANLGSQAPLSTQQSVSRCLSFVSRSTAEDSGKFWSLDGLKEAVTD
jgi:hypothetical protein